MEFLIGIVFIIILIIVWYILTSNKLNRYIVKIEEADSGIDVALTKRYNVLTKMMDIVKSYAKYEKDTLFEIINLRKGMTLQEKVEIDHKMSRNFEKINILAESYPDLRSSQAYNILQKSIVEVEEHLQAARRIYNLNVSSFNQLLVTFPSNIIAIQKSLKKKEFFEADDVKKSDVKIDL